MKCMHARQPGLQTRSRRSRDSSGPGRDGGARITQAARRKGEALIQVEIFFQNARLGKKNRRRIHQILHRATKMKNPSEPSGSERTGRSSAEVCLSARTRINGTRVRTGRRSSVEMEHLAKLKRSGTKSNELALRVWTIPGRWKIEATLMYVPLTPPLLPTGTATSCIQEGSERKTKNPRRQTRMLLSLSLDTEESTPAGPHGWNLEPNKQLLRGLFNSLHVVRTPYTDRSNRPDPLQDNTIPSFDWLGVHKPRI